MSESHVEPMTEAESWDLLDEVRFGRLATSIGGEPDIVPVNFLVHNGKVLMRSAPGTKLAELSINSAVAIEADEVGETQAWSIVVKGTARIVDSFSETYELDEAHLATWLPDDKPIYIEVMADSVSGRRFTRTLD